MLLKLDCQKDLFLLTVLFYYLAGGISNMSTEDNIQPTTEPLSDEATNAEPTADTPKKEYVYDRQQKTFFLTINNPKEKGLDREKIIDIIHTKFKHVTYWCMCDEQGSTYHTHVYILLSKKKRWSATRKAFLEVAHMEQQVKGSPEQCRAYIRKEGKKYESKVETNFLDTFYEEGHIPDYFVSADKTEMLLQIDELLETGLKPEEIMEKSIVFRQYESLIRKQFFARLKKETPVERDLTFVYHTGNSGSGKSYTYVQLCNQYGEDNVYFSADYSNHCTATFDFYSGEPVVLLDEVKPTSIPYGLLLTLTDKYKQPIHCRYANAWSIYTELHLTSILPPEKLFEFMVDSADRKKDPITQLLRRITKMIYHYKDENGNYCTFEMNGSDYTNYEDLLQKVHGDKEGFIPVKESPFDTSDEEMPFN